MIAGTHSSHVSLIDRDDCNRATTNSQQGSLVVVSTDRYSFVQLDDEAAQRRDQRSFHWFAEWPHSDVRGQVFNLEAGGEITLPHDSCPRHVFIVTGIDGAVDALLEEKVFPLCAHSRLVVLPGTLCTLRARSAASIELTGFISTPPPSTGCTGALVSARHVVDRWTARHDTARRERFARFIGFGTSSRLAVVVPIAWRPHADVHRLPRRAGC
jgi:hypothetical protein